MKLSLLFLTIMAMTVMLTHTRYTYYDGLDSVLGDITNLPGQSVEQLMVICDSIPNCQGFNTENWIKNYILPRNKWTLWAPFPRNGMYVKDSVIILESEDPKE